MTTQEVVLDLLFYANIFGFNEPSLAGADEGEDEGEVVRAISAVDQATQIIYRDGPLSLKYGSRSSYINLPTTISLAFTQGSNTATLASDFAPWMRGCSLMVDGDPVLNRIRDIVFNNVASTFTLLRAYTGATGAHNALVYGDSVLLDPDVVAVLEPVTMTPNIRLRPAQSRAAFMGAHYWSSPSGRGCWYVPWWTTWEKVTGVPTLYRVEEQSDSANVGTSIYLSLNPMPTVAGNVSYDVYRKPVLINRDLDLNEDGGDDPAVAIKSLPSDMIESFLLPIARWKYVVSHPTITNREVRGSLKTEYDEAYMRLKNGASLDPQVSKVRARYI